MDQWLEHRKVFLDEFLRLEGLGDAFNDLVMCPGCSNTPAQFRCRDCLGGTMHCSACVVSLHRNLPLHRLQVRQGSRIILTCVDSALEVEP